ncbi:hypothetical protein M0R45_015677 [Rubus argutus]|uniref:CRIB domain-containing protein n=1 Tax=Rubus argutus TaxID=59490 RepID=A0AAW1XQC2_RUBAR
MTEVLHSPSHHFCSSPRTTASSHSFLRATNRRPSSEDYGCGGGATVTDWKGGSFVAMEIGWPTNVRHVAHVTFDRFNGFWVCLWSLSLKCPEGPLVQVELFFGVSPNPCSCHMTLEGIVCQQFSCLCQRRLYAEGGLQAEGIFRLNGERRENSQEEHNKRGQLNRELYQQGIDIHCLAGLIKVWHENWLGLGNSLLASGFSIPEQVMQCQTEDDCLKLVRLLPLTEVALLDWAVNLMADVVQHEHLNKMQCAHHSHGFGTNMTQMADPLTALMLLST